MSAVAQKQDDTTAISPRCRLVSNPVSPDILYVFESFGLKVVQEGSRLLTQSTLWRNTMKTFSKFIFASLLASSIATSVHAQNHAVNGLILGAGSGALVGQAVGRNTEGTLIGTAVGGVLGYMIGNENDKSYGYAPVQHYRQPVAQYAPANYFHVPPPPHYYQPPPPPPVDRVYSRDYFRGPKICRETITERGFHGRIVRDVTTNCWLREGRPYWGDRPHHRDRHDRRYSDRHWHDRF